MELTLLFPEQLHPAIEERFASWQCEMLLRKGLGAAEVIHYHPEAPARGVLALVKTDGVLVVADPLTVPSVELPSRLRKALEGDSGAVAAVPVANESDVAQQRRGPAIPYLTLRQFQETAAEMASEAEMRVGVDWDEGNPGIYVARTEALAGEEGTLAQALRGRHTVVVSNVYIHRYSSHRGQLRGDILALVPEGAKSVLEFGCGEAALGEAIKRRQGSRVVGIELDPEAAAVARTRIDEVLSGDVRDLIPGIGETFDCIVGGDILEHIDDPWTFLAGLRLAAHPGTKLILSIPNVACWPIVADLLRGRFDYVYMGIACAGHVRFFTRRTIEETLQIAGWEVDRIIPQEPFVTPEFLDLEAKLEASGIPYSKADLETTGYYVVAVSA